MSNKRQSTDTGEYSEINDNRTSQQHNTYSTLNKPVVFTRLNRMILIALIITACIAATSMGVSIYLIIRFNDLTLKVDALEKGKLVKKFKENLLNTGKNIPYV